MKLERMHEGRESVLMARSCQSALRGTADIDAADVDAAGLRGLLPDG